MTETLLTLSNPYDGERRPGTVGFPLPGVEVRLDARRRTNGGPPDRADAARGAAGARTHRLRRLLGAAGGHGRLRSTGGWFRTGDLASIDGDGYLSLRGRRLDLIISGGFNVYPAEVEDVLLSHPGVAEVAVTGTPSEEWGEAVTAWVVPVAGDLDADDLPPSPQIASPPTSARAWSGWSTPSPATPWARSSATNCGDAGPVACCG